MATTGTYTFGLENADVLTEAFERIGVRAASITAEHIDSAVRSMGLIFVEWHNKGFRQYKFEQFTLTPTVVGQASFTLNARVLQVFTAVHRIASSSTDTPIYQVGRQDYDFIHNKTYQGARPDRFFVDRQRAAPIMYVWPTFNTIANSVIISAIVRNQDIGFGSDNPEIPYIWYDAMCASLAKRLAEKYAPERLVEKGVIEETAVNLAMNEDKETGDTTFTVNYSR